MQKENEELRDCTFKPQTNKKSMEIVAGDSKYSDKDSFYNKLYKEGENKD